MTLQWDDSFRRGQAHVKLQDYGGTEQNRKTKNHGISNFLLS